MSPTDAHKAHTEIIKNATSSMLRPYSGEVNVSIDKVYTSDSFANFKVFSIQAVNNNSLVFSLSISKIGIAD